MSDVDEVVEEVESTDLDNTASIAFGIDQEGSSFKYLTTGRWINSSFCIHIVLKNDVAVGDLNVVDVAKDTRGGGTDREESKVTMHI